MTWPTWLGLRGEEDEDGEGEDREDDDEWIWVGLGGVRGSCWYGPVEVVIIMSLGLERWALSILGGTLYNSLHEKKGIRKIHMLIFKV